MISGINIEISADEALKLLKVIYPDLATACGVQTVEPPLVIHMINDFEILKPI
jgi:hypothetical protein